ncbi:hypothetical protein [Nocardioides pacificus]
MRTAPHTDKGFLLALVGAFALLAALTPLAMMLDDRTDRDRPMYEDVNLMMERQARHVVLYGEGEPVSLDPGESVTVADKDFTTSDGVRLRVVVGDRKGYCVSAENEHGKSTGWQCSEGMKEPAEDA